jgi:hypothetical protein
MRCFTPIGCTTGAAKSADPLDPADAGWVEGAAVVPPGICVADLEARMEEIAAACWARTSRITRSMRFAHLVTIEIVRRDPLAAAHVITSPLAAKPRPSRTDHAELARARGDRTRATVLTLLPPNDTSRGPGVGESDAA